VNVPYWPKADNAIYVAIGGKRTWRFALHIPKADKLQLTAM